MGNVLLRMSSPSELSEECLTKIRNETGFTQSQIKNLWNRFSELDVEQKGHLTKTDLCRVQELQTNPLGERIIQAFFADGEQRRKSHANHNGNSNGTHNDNIITISHNDDNEDNVVNFDDFVRVFARFRPIKKDNKKNLMNTREDKLKFVFNMYDFDHKGFITTDDFLDILTLMNGATTDKDHLESIARRVFIEADVDGEGIISFEKFCLSLKKIDVENKMSMLHLTRH